MKFVQVSDYAHASRRLKLEEGIRPVSNIEEFGFVLGRIVSFEIKKVSLKAKGV